MMKHFGTCVLLALVILLSACIPGQASTPVQPGGPVSPAQPQPTITAGEKIATLVPEVGQTPQATSTEASQLSDPKAMQTAIANIRALLNAPSLELTFTSLERSPNASNHLAILFVDQQENRYYVRQDTLQPLEFTLEKPIQETQGAKKTTDELRAMAMQLATAHSTKFPSIGSKLKYTEGNKGGENNFFRWEMEGTDVGGMPAILQIGLKQDGSIFSYLNSLDFLP